MFQQIPDEDIVNSVYKFSYASNDNYARKTRFGRSVWTGTSFFVSPGKKRLEKYFLTYNSLNTFFSISCIGCRWPH